FSRPTNRPDPVAQMHSGLRAERRAATALSCGAWRWIPFRTITFLLELRTHNERRLKVLRIVDYRCHQQHPASARKLCHVEVFGDDGVLAIRNTVPAQISGSHVRGYHFQTSAHRRWGS